MVEESKLNEAIEASFPRNTAAAVMWDAVWGLGAACCLLYAVVPAYLLALGASKMLVQTVVVGFSVATGLQLLSPRISHGPRRKVRIYFIWSLFPALWLIYGTVASIGWDRLSDRVWIPLFVVMCAGLSVIMHLGTPSYTEMLVQNIPLKKRGRLGSARNIAFGVFGIFGVWLASWLMKQWPEPVNFHASFIFGSSIMLVSCISILFIRDLAGTMQSEEVKTLPVMETVRNLLNNFNFRVFLVFYGFLVVGQALAPLFIGYAKDVLAMPLSHVAHFSFTFFLGAIVVGVFVAPLADRHGFRLIAIISAIMLGGAFLIPLVAGASRYAVLVGYALYAGTIFVNYLVLTNLGIELVPQVKPAAIFAVGSTTVIPFSLITAPLAGRFVDFHGEKGYHAIFMMGLVLALCALVGFITVVREPRTGQEIYVRIRRI